MMYSISMKDTTPLKIFRDNILKNTHMICTSAPSLTIVEPEDTHKTPSRQLTATCTGLVNLTINKLNITCNYTTNMKIYYTCT